MSIKRSSGILMPISSLPSPYGIGTLGRAAYDFVDFLSESNQSWWQILPVGPTSYGDSPYQSFSTFAGNPYFIDLDMLIEDGLLSEDDLNGIDFGDNPRYVDYEKIYNERFKVLRKAVNNSKGREDEEFKKFFSENQRWLTEYALYMALKAHFGMKSWIEWEDEDIRLHKADAVAKYSEELEDDILFYEYLQFLFYKQWDALREYAKENGIGIIGDIPIYVALDSADVWSDPKEFLLDEKNCPKAVAGVPPDYFSEDGQLWGNPLYNWDLMKSDGYGWWIRRIEGAQKLYDIIRIDHFRGFESFWAVPYGEDTAKKGEWVKGPGMDFVSVLKNWFWNIQFIAEDLGILTDDVRTLLKDSTFPGMKVLEFAFDAKEPSDYLPHMYDKNCVCYAGTHDNDTLVGWLETADEDDIAFAMSYLAVDDKADLPGAILRAGMASTADLFVAQIQDFLALDSSARINVPGTLGGNWQWRLLDDDIDDWLSLGIAEMTKIYGRVK